MPSKIEWVKNPDGTEGETWNPITGCTPISAGCVHCYAKRMSKRLAGRFGYPENGYHCPTCDLNYHLLGGEHCPQCGGMATETSSFDVTFHEDKLRQPLKWKKPRRIFVCSMGDLFHIDVRPQWLEDIFAVIKKCPQHTFQILTKRPGKMKTWFEWYGSIPENVQLGTTPENQAMADLRIPILLQIPAAVRFVSIEPMLGPVDPWAWLDKCDHCFGNNPCVHFGDCINYSGGHHSSADLDWVIVGAETGPGARTMDLNWARDIRNQCAAAGVPFFFKKDSQGRHTLDGRTWEQFPEVSDAK